jgi:hypothetical protein
VLMAITSPPCGRSSSPKMTVPKTIARFFASILFLVARAATWDKCSTRALSEYRCMGDSRRIFDLRTTKLLEAWSSIDVSEMSRLVGNHHTNVFSVLQAFLKGELEERFW